MNLTLRYEGRLNPYMAAGQIPIGGWTRGEASCKHGMKEADESKQEAARMEERPANGDLKDSMPAIQIDINAKISRLLHVCIILALRYNTYVQCVNQGWSFQRTWTRGLSKDLVLLPESVLWF
jgi:hypothetical protein